MNINCYLRFQGGDKVEIKLEIYSAVAILELVCYDVQTMILSVAGRIKFSTLLIRQGIYHKNKELKG